MRMSYISATNIATATKPLYAEAACIGVVGVTIFVAVIFVAIIFQVVKLKYICSCYICSPYILTC